MDSAVDRKTDRAHWFVVDFLAEHPRRVHGGGSSGDY